MARRNFFRQPVHPAVDGAAADLIGTRRPGPSAGPGFGMILPQDDLAACPAGLQPTPARSIRPSRSVGRWPKSSARSI